MELGVGSWVTLQVVQYSVAGPQATDMRQGRLCVKGSQDFELGFLVPSPAVLDQEALDNITKLGSFSVGQS